MCNRNYFYLALLFLASSTFGKESLPLHKIKLPPGFHISVYAYVDNARSMTLAPSGNVYVGNRRGDAVYVVHKPKNPEKPAPVTKIIDGLNSPNGVAFHEGDLYIADISRVLRLDDIENNLSAIPQPHIVNDSYPTDRHHGWKFIAFGPDGWLYVPVGAPCNVCEKENPIYSTITRIKLDGSSREIFAHGVRNSVGFDWHPETNELWFTDNGRDWLGDNSPNDELNHAPQKGLHFGFPYCHDVDLQDPKFGKGSCQEYQPPVQPMGPHVAALGMRFYTGDMFPPKYKNRIFIAQHGSWNRSEKIGYRVMMVTLKDNKPSDYDVFAEGWLQGEEVWGRPVDVLVMPDGALLVSDDYADVIYRIEYNDRS